MRKRADYDANVEDPAKIRVLENCRPFVGFGVDTTLKQVFRDHDWEEPLPLNSPWLQRRRGLLETVRQHFRALVP